MSTAPADPPADGIEEGKRLIRLGGDKGLSLAERVAERFNRMTWRTPIHSMRLKGRYPLKLLAVPDDPFFGNTVRGNALLDGRLSFRGESRALDGFDFARPDVSRGFAEYVQRFEWLRDLSSVTTRAIGAPIAEELMRGWLDAHADTVSEPAWRVDHWGRRMLAWTAHAPLILSSTDLVYRSRVLNTLARGARHVERGADKVPPGAARVAAWAGIVSGTLLIPGGDPRRGAAEAGFARALAASVFEDGGSVARSPVAELDIVMLLTLLRESYVARRVEPPAVLATTLARMVPALTGVAMGDHGLSSWQGGGPVAGEEIDRVVAATGVRARPLRQARDWGYQRLSAQGTVLIVDAAPPPVARLVEGGCASTLAFELSDGAQRIVVNCGGARSAVAQVPAALCEGLRTTAAHSTLVVGETNSTAIHADGTLGRGVAEVELTRQEGETASRIEASHDGYARRFGFLHRRQMILTGDGREVKGDDMLLPVGRKRRPAETAFAVRFHLAPGIQVSPTADGMAALMRLPGTGQGTALWQFRCRGGTLAIDDSLWIDPDGKPIATMQLVVNGMAPAGGANISWLFKRAR